MDDVGILHILERMADAAINAAKAKKGAIETKRRIVAAITPMARELVDVGMDQAIIATDNRKRQLLRLPVRQQLPEARGLGVAGASFPAPAATVRAPRPKEPPHMARYIVLAFAGGLAVAAVVCAALYFGAMQFGMAALDAIINR